MGFQIVRPVSLSKEIFSIQPKRLFLEKFLVQFWNPNMEAVKKVVASIQGQDYLAA